MARCCCLSARCIFACRLCFLLSLCIIQSCFGEALSRQHALDAFTACIRELETKYTYVKSHGDRYVQSFSLLLVGHWTAFNLTSRRGRPYRVLELGGTDDKTGPIQAFPHCTRRALKPYRRVEVSVYSKDLRWPWDSVPSNTFDLVICLEVLEHIADLSPVEQGKPVVGYMFPVAFWKSGMETLLNEIHRVLKREGQLLLSTPNTNSLRHIERAIKHQVPLLDRKHVRELSTEEIGQLLMSHGLSNSLLVVDTEPWSGRWDKAMKSLLHQVLDHLEVATGLKAFNVMRRPNIMLMARRSPPRDLGRGESPGLWMMVEGLNRAESLMAQEGFQVDRGDDK
eukprot:TRINITY_DN80229_c0_g1_i1.p1 TRINITY_DN80229_c0_g1~~TRINITY_DN80229_c0_g1_i1.p1  ORF type:complete len:339 (-),score=36.52 TRINITY_DN80229_c0_g1_i1:338-1354(-)